MFPPRARFSGALSFAVGLFAVIASSFTHNVCAQQTAATAPYVINLTPQDSMLVEWRPTQKVSAPKELSAPSESNKLAEANAQFVKSLLEVLQDALITNLQARVTLESFALEKGRVRLGGVLLRDAKIGLRLKNDGVQRLSDALLHRYGNNPKKPAWLGVLQLAKFGIYNDLEIRLSLGELSLRQLAIDAEALKVAGLALNADVGPNSSDSETPASRDEFRAILRVLQQAAISRAEANLNLEHLAAHRLKLSLEGAALKDLHVLVALRRADASPPSP